MAISKIILNGTTQIDLTQDTVAASNLISPNTAHGADGLAIVGEATGGGNEFIITLSKNPTTGYWEPDKTFAEMEDAFEEEKIFVVKTNVSYTEATADGDLGLAGNGTEYSYEVHEFVDEYPNPQVYVIEQQYIFRASGLTKYFEGIDYDTYDGDALANEVPNGKIFYNSTGRVVGSATSRVSSDLTVSGATVTAPAGYYASSASKTVASGTAGTPTATKGTVSNHQVSVTPSVTNTTGYITGSTKTGTAITVTASELASGNKEITANGTNIDVVGYSTASVSVPNSVVVTDTSNTTGTSAVITADNVDTLITKTITSNGTYTASSDSADGYSSVTVNVSSGTPSATSHMIYFEFTDNTDATITGYWNDSFISNAITATTPTTYNNKIVDSASLDNVTWYTRPTETWETLFNDNVGYYPNEDTTEAPYCWITELGDVSIPLNSVWRVTFDNVEYRFTATYYHSSRGVYIIGNPLYVGDSDDGSGVPFAFFNIGYGAWSGAADVQPYSQQTIHSVKIEHLVTA